MHGTDDQDDDDPFSMLDPEPEDEKPQAEIVLGLVTGHPCSSAELEARYGDARHDDESPTYFSDPETGEVVALMYDKELKTTIEVVIQQGVPNADA